MARKEAVIEEEAPKHHHPHYQAPPETQAQPAEPLAAEPPAQLAAVPMPPPLGKVPTSIKQLVPTTGLKATHFTGPVVSGPPPGSTAMQGAAVVTLALQLDYSMGNFSLPIQFPPGALLLYVVSSEYAAFTTAPSFSLGRTSGAADILAAETLGTAPDSTLFAPVTGALPFPWETVAGGAPSQAFLNVTGNGANTVGGAFLLIAYALIARPWN